MILFVPLNCKKVVHQSGNSLNPILLGIYGGFITRHDQLLTSFLTPLSSREVGGAEMSKHLIMA